MVFAITGIVVGFIALASIVVISIIGFNKVNHIQGDYNTKVKDVVDQVNSAQHYEYEFDKKHKAQTNDLVKNVEDVRNTYLTKDDATSTYLKKSDAGATVKTEKLNVADNLIADKNFSQTNNIRFSNKWTGFPDNATDKSEISNDTDGFKKLMIVGNKSAGGERKVGVWDKLDVHGNLGVDGSTTVGGNFSIDGGTMYNKGRQHIHGEELLYLLNKSGVVIGREWGGNGNLSVQGDAGVNGGITGGRLATHDKFNIQTAGGPGWWNNITKAGDKVLTNWTENVEGKKIDKNGITLAPWNAAGGMRVHGAGADLNGDLQMQNNGSGIAWGNNYSKIYDDGNLHINTDDVMNIKAPVYLNVDTPRTGIKGGLAVGSDMPDGWRGANFLRKDGRWTHLDWVGGGANYLRGYTQVDDGLGVAGNANITGDIVKNGGNNWIIHTPDDGRRTMYIAPSKVAGNQDWDWDKNMNINENGDLNVRGKTTISRGDGSWNWLRVEGNHKDNIYLGSDGGNRGIWADGPRDFSIFNQGKKGLTVTQGGEVNANTVNVANKWRLGDTGDDWLRLNIPGKAGTDNYSGGFAANSLWTRNFYNASDKTLKKNIADVSTEEINKLSQLDPKSYQFIDDKNNTKRYGFVAQDVEKVYPDLVSDGQDGKKALNYTDMIPLAVAGIQQINKQVQKDKLCINNVCLTEADLLKLKKL
jgi:hypothetical protein